MEQNTVRIHRAVDNFISHKSHTAVSIPYDDLVQEACIAFLEYIRKCDSEEQLDTFPWYDVKNGMLRLVVQMQPLSVPIRTSGFQQIVNSMPDTISYDVLAETGMEIDGMSKHWVEDTDTKLDFIAFMDTQPENAKRVTSMRLYGMKNADIADQCGVDKTTISVRLKKLKTEYLKFGGDENE